MGLHPTRAIGDSAFVAVALGTKPPGLVGAVATGFTAFEMGKGLKHRTIIKLTTPVSVVTTPDTTALADGILVYTFPAGQVIVHEVYGDVGLEIDDATNEPDTPEVGLGSVIATGAVATLGAGASTWEDTWGPHVMTGCDVGATAADAIQKVTRPGKVIASAGVHAIYLNIADTWGNGDGTKDVFLQAARFIIDWTQIPVEGV